MTGTRSWARTRNQFPLITAAFIGRNLHAKRKGWEWCYAVSDFRSRHAILISRSDVWVMHVVVDFLTVCASYELRYRM